MQRIESIQSQLNPFVGSGFLDPLIEHKSTTMQTGWTPHFLQSSKQNVQLPAYIKHHSYGEYVFDWSWAEAYQNHGLNYYPKLLIAAPFTPSTGPRLITNEHNLEHINGKELSLDIQQYTQQQNLSGAHILFMTPQEHDLLAPHNWHTRYGIQFHWFNHNYQSFDDFIGRFKSRKRKNVLKERAFIEQQNIKIKHVLGYDISNEQWQFFYACYQDTYARRRMSGYISLDAFKRFSHSLGNNMFMLIAERDAQPLACALYFFDCDTLYGRYWGALTDMPSLHFELCYYQGIEFCIKHGLKHFDPGTQGEHKIARGFEPVLTQSLHYLQHEGFHNAVGDFVKQEYEELKQYKQACYEQLPFSEQHTPDIRNRIVFE